MAHLLLMYQYMRAQREVNQLTADEFKFTQKYDRIKRNIEQTQKMYASKKANIEQTAKTMIAQGKQVLTFQAFGGMTSVNPMDYSGNNQFILTAAAQYFEENGCSKEEFATLYKAYTTEGKGSCKVYDENTKTYNYLDAFGSDEESAKTKANLFETAMYNARQMQSYRQNQVSMLQNNYEGNVSIWQKYMEEQLEVEQDAALAPLNYEETMMELEKTSIHTRLEEKKQELQDIKQELSQRVKDDSPKFGLG